MISGPIGRRLKLLILMWLSDCEDPTPHCTSHRCWKCTVPFLFLLPEQNFRSTKGHQGPPRATKGHKGPSIVPHIHRRGKNQRITPRTKYLLYIVWLYPPLFFSSLSLLPSTPLNHHLLLTEETRKHTQSQSQAQPATPNRNHGLCSPTIEVHVSVLEEDFTRHPPLPLDHRNPPCLSRWWKHVQSADHCSSLPHYGKGTRCADRQNFKGGTWWRSCSGCYPRILWKGQLWQGEVAYQSFPRGQSFGRHFVWT